MRRREFLGVLGGAAAAWPLVAGAQQRGRMRLVGIMPPARQDDTETRARLGAFLHGLDQLGWKEGRNVRFEYRWTAGNADLVKSGATELAALKPDVILVGTTPGVQALKRETGTIPIVFANVADPVASGLVQSLAKPGGNVTGFTAVEYAIVGKWLELLKELVPIVERVALLGNPEVIFTKGFFQAFEGAASSFAVKPQPTEIRNAADIERAMESFAREPKGGILVVPEFTASIHRARIFELAAYHRLPAVFPFRFYAIDGGLASYGPDQIDQYRGAARYVDRILKGEKPAELPIQAPTKFDLIINMKTAKAMGLTIPPSVLARADEVIE
jgi:putative tryptophan/tyrosine transport system substrate-binding protein